MERPNIEEQMSAIIGSTPMEIEVNITEHNPVKAEPKLEPEPQKTQPEPEVKAEHPKCKGKIERRLRKDALQRMVDAKIDRIINEHNAPKSYLLINTSTGECIEIAGTITVGKETACDFVINNPTVSRYHAQIEARGSKLTVKDTSLNGTYFNGKKLIKNQETEIGEGSIIFSNEKFQIKRK